MDVVTYYAMSLRKRVQGNFVFGSEIVAAKVIFSDKEVIEGFFEDYFEEIGIAILQDSDKESKSSFSSAGQSKLTEEMSALGSLASVIGARSANGIERDLKVLFVRWKGDGLKVAQAAFLANPSLNKTDRTNNIETAKKVFDSMGISGRLLEEFAGYDAAMTAAEKSAATKANKQGKQITGGFWGRGNKQK